MQEDQIRQVLEQIDPKGELTQSLQEELVTALKGVHISGDSEDKPLNGITEESLKAQLVLETDWRKKASIVARIISLGLNT